MSAPSVDHVLMEPSQMQQFACVDGMRLQASFSSDRAYLRFDNGRRLSLRRVQNDGFLQYASASFEFRRSGPRAAFVDGSTLVRVRAGDTLRDIAIRAFGHAEAADEIARVNGAEISDPNLIRPGQMIRLPPRERSCRRVLV
jgi:nucleoid-associated protein YgaU